MHSLVTWLVAGALAATPSSPPAEMSRVISPGLTEGVARKKEKGPRGNEVLSPVLLQFEGRQGQRVEFRISTTPATGSYRFPRIRHLSSGAAVRTFERDDNRVDALEALLPEGGRYELSFGTGHSSADAIPYRVEFVARPPPPIPELRLGEARTGTLTNEDELDERGRRYDLYRIEVPPPAQRLMIVLRSEAALRVLAGSRLDEPFAASDRKQLRRRFKSGALFLRVTSDEAGGLGDELDLHGVVAPLSEEAPPPGLPGLSPSTGR